MVDISHRPLLWEDDCLVLPKTSKMICAISPTIRPVVGFRVSGDRRMTVHLPDRYSFGECPGCEWSVTIGREANLEPTSSRPPISGGGPMHSKAVTAQCAPLGG
jgi:hypothetical protein